MRHRFISLLVLLLAVLGSASIGHAANVYNVHLTIGSGAVNGFIVTDGTIGTIAQSNILDWSLTLNDGVQTFTLKGPLSGANSGVAITSTAMTATPTQLIFNFGGAAGGEFFQFPAPGSGQTDLCFQTSTGTCGGLTGPGEKLFITGDTAILISQSGTLVVANTGAGVPALSSLAAAALALLLIVVAVGQLRLNAPARTRNG